jgi:hypothetical protein
MGWLRDGIMVAGLLCMAGPLAESARSEDAHRDRGMLDHPWTVATMAPDGSWGVATRPFIYQAIAAAVSNCRRMSRQNIGCGAQLKVIRGGWIVAMRCGRMNILAAEASIDAAESAAASQENELRLAYAERISYCARLMTVNPFGNVIRHGPDVARSGRTASESGSR